MQAVRPMYGAHVHSVNSASRRDRAPAPRRTETVCGDVLTQHNNNARTGANTCETTLTPAVLRTPDFGKVFCRPVDAQIYAQPLVAQALDLPGTGVRNVVFVATMKNTVFAFDADDPRATDPLWRVNLGPAVSSTDYYPHSNEIRDSIGVLGTPVIDRAKGLLYAVAATHEPGPDGDRLYRHRLHALNLTTGDASLPSRLIEGTYPGSAPDASGGIITFNPRMQMQRASLLLDRGRVYVAFGSHGDARPYHGWVFAYDATTLEPAGRYLTTPKSYGGGVWQSGQGLTADSKGNVYFVGANGFGSDETDPVERPQSIIKVRPSDDELRLADYYTPHDWHRAEDENKGLGSTGVVLIPETDLLVVGSKDGLVYVTHQSALGHISDNDTAAVQRLWVNEKRIHSAPVYWQGEAGGTLYVWGQGGHLRAFSLEPSGERFHDEPAHISGMSAPSKGWSGSISGGTVTVSANGTRDGIVWATLGRVGKGNPEAGILRAFDANDVSVEIWNSQADAKRDAYGDFSKFVSVTVANGHVYVPTFSRELVVYGVRSATQGAAIGCGASLSSAAQPSYVVAPWLSLFWAVAALWFGSKLG